jgi:hypothetical protein
LLARHVDEADVRTLRAASAVGSVDVRTPNLEAIFVALMGPAAEPVTEEARA